jgi:4-amino-4-deoxy-L-arabinose transferase-like glycosyltransferase
MIAGAGIALSRGRVLRLLFLKDPVGPGVCAVFLLIAVWAFIFLPRLGTIPLQPGDEARVAVNALEMVMHGDVLVTHYDGAPELNNTKPPLLVWLMALGLPFFDNPLIAIRLPSALASLGTVLLLNGFAQRYLRDRAAGLFAGLVLLTSWGFTGLHTGATGDYDALLTCCITLYCLAFFGAVERPPGSRAGFVAWFGLGVLAAIMTKGVAGAMPLPGLLIYAGLRRRLFSVFREPAIWLAVFGVVGALAAFFVAREVASPGYLAAALHNDVTGLAAGRIFSDYHPPWDYYFVFIVHLLYSPWFLPLPLLLVLAAFDREAAQRRALLLCLAVGLWIFLVINLLATKFFWYFLPVMPFAALIAGMGLSRLRRVLSQRFPLTADAGFLLLFAYAVVAHAKQNPVPPELIRNEKPHDRQLNYGRFLPLLRTIEPARPHLVADSGLENLSGFEHWNPIALFHAEIETRAGTPTRILARGDRPAIGDFVASCDQASIDWLEHQFTLGGSLAEHGCIARTIRGTTDAAPTGAP